MDSIDAELATQAEIEHEQEQIAAKRQKPEEEHKQAQAAPSTASSSSSTSSTSYQPWRSTNTNTNTDSNTSYSIVGRSAHPTAPAAAPKFNPFAAQHAPPSPAHPSSGNASGSLFQRPQTYNPSATAATTAPSGGFWGEPSTGQNSSEPVEQPPEEQPDETGTCPACGAMTRKKMVQDAKSPNAGRMYWVCINKTNAGGAYGDNANSEDGKDSGCNFFKWADTILCNVMCKCGQAAAAYRYSNGPNEGRIWITCATSRAEHGCDTAYFLDLKESGLNCSCGKPAKESKSSTGCTYFECNGAYSTDEVDKNGEKKRNFHSPCGFFMWSDVWRFKITCKCQDHALAVRKNVWERSDNNNNNDDGKKRRWGSGAKWNKGDAKKTNKTYFMCAHQDLCNSYKSKGLPVPEADRKCCNYRRYNNCKCGAPLVFLTWEGSDKMHGKPYFFCKALVERTITNTNLLPRSERSNHTEESFLQPNEERWFKLYQTALTKSKAMMDEWQQHQSEYAQLRAAVVSVSSSSSSSSSSSAASVAVSSVSAAVPSAAPIAANAQAPPRS